MYDPKLKIVTSVANFYTVKGAWYMQDSIFNIRKRYNFRYLVPCERPIVFFKNYQRVVEVKGIVTEAFIKGSKQFTAQFRRENQRS